MKNNSWLKYEEMPKDQEGAYMVYAPDDDIGSPYSTGNFAIMQIYKTSSGYMGVIDGKFDFDATTPTKFMHISEYMEQAKDMC